MHLKLKTRTNYNEIECVNVVKRLTHDIFQTVQVLSTTRQAAARHIERTLKYETYDVNQMSSSRNTYDE